MTWPQAVPCGPSCHRNPSSRLRGLPGCELVEAYQEVALFDAIAASVRAGAWISPRQPVSENHCCRSARFTSDVMASNWPVSINDCAMLRTVPSVAMDIPDAVLTRATPRASNSFIPGMPARPTMLIGVRNPDRDDH